MDHTSLERYQLPFYLYCSGSRGHGCHQLCQVWVGIQRCGPGVLVKDQTSFTISPGLQYPLSKRPLRSAPSPPLLCTDISRCYPTGGGGGRASLCLQKGQQPKVELITSLPLANQNPKGLIKIPLVAKPWVRSDFISEISEPDWKMPKQPTCLNTKQTSERPFFSHRD